MEFLPSCGSANTTVWMHHIDANKTHRKKAIEELHKNATCYFEQIQAAAPHKTAAEPSKTYKTCWAHAGEVRTMFFNEPLHTEAPVLADQ